MALGKIPSLQCKVCLCLYHHECAKSHPESSVTPFTCEVKEWKNLLRDLQKNSKNEIPFFSPSFSFSQNCNFKFTTKTSSATSKKHHQQASSGGVQHNFDKSPQALVTVKGKKFILYKTDESGNGFAKKVQSKVWVNRGKIDEKLGRLKGNWWIFFLQGASKVAGDQWKFIFAV